MESIKNRDRQKPSQDDQASGRKRKIMTCLNIFFIVLFTVIIGSIFSVFVAIKQEAESESISASDPEQIIRVICGLTPYPISCFDPILSLHRNMTAAGDYSGERIKTTPSTIFILSLRAAFDELNSVGSSSQTAISKVKNSTLLSAFRACDMSVRDSATFVNVSMTMIRDEISRRDLEERIVSALENIESCLSRLDDGSEGMDLKKKVAEAKEFVVNCSDIFAKMDKIIAMFKPPAFPSIEDSRNFLLSSFEYGYANLFPVFFYCLQYLVLVMFFCIVLKL